MRKSSRNQVKANRNVEDDLYMQPKGKGIQQLHMDKWKTLETETQRLANLNVT